MPMGLTSPPPEGNLVPCPSTTEQHRRFGRQQARRSSSCHYEDRPIHVVCSPRPEYLAVITAYLPDPSEWIDGFTRRGGL